MEDKAIEKVLLILFYLLALATIAAYFLADDIKIFWYCGGTTIAIRLIHYFRRFFM